jgi:hypothetical protein
MMITITRLKKFSLAALLCAVFSVALIGCSDKSSSDFDPFDHSHDVPVSDMEKHKFEHKFADQCVAREKKATTNPDTTKLEKDCMCIAKYMLKDLTAAESERFLEEDQNTQSLVIKYDAAAYHCLQEKTVKGPDFSRK